ncbi:MAG: hypothetical protein JXJ19_05090 [Elusimicrobia bacterium]|nr:hypothetical protein [Elusimicrobiota bacterium]
MNSDVKPENNNMEKELETLEHELDILIPKLLDVKTEFFEIGRVIDRLLEIIPSMKKKKAILKFERAVNKYRNALFAQGINQALFDHIISKRRAELEEKRYELDLRTIIKIEKRIGIFSHEPMAKSNIFDKFRIVLPGKKDLDEIEVIIRKVKLKLELEKKKELKKDDLVRYFAYEAGFEDIPVVIELLSNKTLSDAIKKNVVTEGRLTKELGRIKGDFSELNRRIMNTVNKEVSRMNEMLGQEVPMAARVFSNYIVNPLAASSGVIGFTAVLLFTAGKYLAGPLKGIMPGLADIMEATGLPMICSMLKPQLVYILGFGFIFVSGFTKMLDEKVKKSVMGKKENAE